ncbi:SMC family protein [Giardia muris]|uniref:SMC family protein n=1 Tax=Giardia muris TaxID=5742 RepID=A0A4Z1SVE9_GIAMU|nr:SMC family protein [Giardia muris]|eukprot:TNJ29754.1 SMC family protein [Giardia muris]
MPACEELLSRLRAYNQTLTQMMAEPAAALGEFERVESEFRGFQRSMSLALANNSFSAEELNTLTREYSEYEEHLKRVRALIAEPADENDNTDLSADDLCVSNYPRARPGSAGPVRTTHSVRISDVHLTTAAAVPTVPGVSGVARNTHLLTASKRPASASAIEQQAMKLNEGVDRLRANLLSLNRAAKEPDISLPPPSRDKQGAGYSGGTASGGATVAQITANLRRENSVLSSEVQMLREKLATFEGELLELRKEKKSLVLTAQSERSELDTLRRMVETLSHERQQLIDVIREKVDLVTELRQELELAERSVTSLQKECAIIKSSAQQAGSELTAEVEFLRKDNEALRQRIGTLESLDVEGKILELERMAAEMGDMELVIRQLKHQKREMLENHEQTRMTLMDRIEVLEAQLTATTNTTTTTTTNGHRTSVDRGSMRRENEGLRTRALLQQPLTEYESGFLTTRDPTDYSTESPATVTSRPSMRLQLQTPAIASGLHLPTSQIVNVERSAIRDDDGEIDVAAMVRQKREQRLSRISR